MITATDLKFEPVEYSFNSPWFTCSMCGTKTRLKPGVYTADYHFTIDAHITFTCCCATCVIEFLSMQHRTVVNKYINDQLNSAIEYHKKTLGK